MDDRLKAEDEFVRDLIALMEKYKPSGAWQTWLSADGRVIILKRKPDVSSNP